MYLLIEDKNERITAFRLDRIKRVIASRKDEEPDKFEIMLEADSGECIFLKKLYSDWAEAKEDMLMLILGVERLNAPRTDIKEEFQIPQFATPEEVIEYARTRLGKQRKTNEEKKNAEHRMRI